MNLTQDFVNAILEKEGRDYSPKVILDIGSRDLDQSIELSKVFPNTKILAFEPIPEQFQICYEKSKNYPNIQVYNIALSDKEGFFDFWVVEGNIGASSLLEPITIPYGNWENNTWSKISVLTKTLDNFLRDNDIHSVDCIWMDVQGSELSVLHGAKDILKTVQYIHTEASPKPYYVDHCGFDELKSYLIDSGFDVTFNDTGHVYGEGDFICTRNKNLKYKDFTIVFQGPTDNIKKLDFMKNISDYKNLFSKIILSTYTEHLAQNWRVQKFCEDNDIKIVHQSIQNGISDVKYESTGNDCGVKFQTVSTLLGLQNVQTKYVVKHRVDESYSNLNLLLDKFLENDEKLVTGGTFFAQKCYYEYHAADHLMVSRTDRLIETFERSIKMISESTMEAGPEILYTKNYLRSCGEKPSSENHDELMLKYIDFLPDKYLEPFIIRANHWNQVWYNSESLGERRNTYETICDMIESKDVVLNQFYT